MEAPQRFTVVVWVGAVSEVVVEWEAVDFTGAVVVADMAAAVVADTGKVKIPVNSSPAIALHECDERRAFVVILYSNPNHPNDCCRASVEGPDVANINMCARTCSCERKDSNSAARIADALKSSRCGQDYR